MRKNKLFWMELTFIFAIVFILISYKIPQGKVMYKKTGRYVIGTYDYGLFISQASNDYFYNVSPLDFYIKNGYSISDKKNYLLAQNNNYNKTNSLPKIEQLYYSIASYFSLTQPFALFDSLNENVKLTSSTKDDVVRFTLISPNKNLSDKNIFMTMSFNENDLIIDNNGYMYTKINEYEKAGLKNLYDIEIRDINDISQTILSIDRSAEFIVIINKNMPGLIKISNTDNAYKLGNIDKEKMLISIAVQNSEQPFFEINFQERLQ